MPDRRAKHDLIGAPVEVRSRFEGAWCSGFEVVDVLDTQDGTRLKLRRTSDGSVLPSLFAVDEVGPVHR